MTPQERIVVDKQDKVRHEMRLSELRSSGLPDDHPLIVTEKARIRMCDERIKHYTSIKDEEDT